MSCLNIEIEQTEERMIQRFAPIMLILWSVYGFFWLFSQDSRRQSAQVEPQVAQDNKIIEMREVVAIHDCSRIVEVKTFELIREVPSSVKEYENQLVLENGASVVRTWGYVDEVGELWCANSVVPVDSVRDP